MNNTSVKNKLPLIILTGPTAAGKTGLSIKLAKKIDGEIISADSMQVYRGMDIGTAKISREEMQGVPHHLIDILDPHENFDVTVFQKLAMQAAEDICSRGKIPILAGGTGFYIQALLYGIDFTEEADPSIRKELEELAETEDGRSELVSRLRAVDPKAFETIHPNNTRKVIRALEFYMIHQQPISGHNENERKKEAVFDSRYYVLTMDRGRLYERINRRVDLMLEQGLVDEVKGLRDMGLDESYVSMQGIGYKEILEYLEGKTDLDTAVEKLKQNTRHFAKRQLTWFRRERDVIWLEKEKFEDDEAILSFIAARVRYPAPPDMII